VREAHPTKTFVLFVSFVVNIVFLIWLRLRRPGPFVVNALLVARQFGELAEFTLHLIAPALPELSALGTIQHLLTAL